jgi:hypothetical protein
MPGRCAGCGETGSVPRVARHVFRCDKWAALFRHDPALALDPEAEYQRWLAEDKDDEREQRREVVAVQTETRRAAGLTRFRTRDILADEEDEQ